MAPAVSVLTASFCRVCPVALTSSRLHAELNRPQQTQLCRQHCRSPFRHVRAAPSARARPRVNSPITNHRAPALHARPRFVFADNRAVPAPARVASSPHCHPCSATDHNTGGWRACRLAQRRAGQPSLCTERERAHALCRAHTPATIHAVPARCRPCFSWHACLCAALAKSAPAARHADFPAAWRHSPAATCNTARYAEPDWWRHARAAACHGPCQHHHQRVEPDSDHVFTTATASLSTA